MNSFMILSVYKKYETGSLVSCNIFLRPSFILTLVSSYLFKVCSHDV